MNKLFLSLLALLCSVTIFAQTDLIISEYVEGWSTNKAIEVYNPTSSAINLKNYRLTRYSNGADVPPASSTWYVVFLMLS
jgi:predicted extracellular nuclease